MIGVLELSSHDLRHAAGPVAGCRRVELAGDAASVRGGRASRERRGEGVGAVYRGQGMGPQILDPNGGGLLFISGPETGRF